MVTSIALVSPSSFASLVAPGCLDFKMGSSYTRWKAVLDPIQYTEMRKVEKVELQYQAWNRGIFLRVKLAIHKVAIHLYIDLLFNMGSLFIWGKVVANVKRVKGHFI